MRMTSLNNNIQSFLALTRAGLWEKEVRLSKFDKVDYGEIYRLAEEQSVTGLVAAGLEHVIDIKAPQNVALTLAGSAFQIEQINKAMNYFVADLIEKLRRYGVYALLVKGQGVAQCYERPLWRCAGDVDLFLSDDNYKNAVNVLTPLAKQVEDENGYTKHIGFKIDDWEVELHGSLRSGLWKNLDNILDDVQKEVFCGGSVRSWQNDKTQVFLPGADEDVFYVFAHILQHFFKGGIGLRQVCDWCRLLWTYRDSLKLDLLKSRLKKAGIVTEWKAFAAIAVDYLGMPVECMPLYDDSRKWRKKAGRIMKFIIETGNFGHNRDTSYRTESPAIKRKSKTFLQITSDSFRQFFIFPKDSVKVWFIMMGVGIRSLFGK